MGKLASTAIYTWRRIYLNPFSRIRLVEGLAKILLAYGAVLNSFSKLSWVGTSLIIFKISS